MNIKKLFQRFPLTQITIKPSNQSQSDIWSASLCSVYNNNIKLSTSWIQYFLSDCLCFTNFIPWCPPLATFIWCCPPLLTCTETLPPSIFCKRMQQSLTCQFLEENKKDTLKFGSLQITVFAVSQSPSGAFSLFSFGLGQEPGRSTKGCRLYLG